MNKKISAIVSSFLLMMVFFSEACALAQEKEYATANQLFYQANAAYKEGHYGEAVLGYEKIISLGLESGNLYYNLGNSYYKKGEPGEALLNYERAAFFIAGDSNLKSNVDFVCSSLNLGPQPFGNWFLRGVSRTFEGAGIDFLTGLLSLLYVFIFSILFLGLFLDKLKRFIGGFLFVFIALFIVAALSLQNKISALQKRAVVISKEADVKFEPQESATTYFKLTEGSKTEIIEKAKDWYKVRRSDGKMGWVNKKALGLIVDDSPAAPSVP